MNNKLNLKNLKDEVNKILLEKEYKIGNRCYNECFKDKVYVREYNKGFIYIIYYDILHDKIVFNLKRFEAYLIDKYGISGFVYFPYELEIDFSSIDKNADLDEYVDNLCKYTIPIISVKKEFKKLSEEEKKRIKNLVLNSVKSDFKKLVKIIVDEFEDVF